MQKKNTIPANQLDLFSQDGKNDTEIAKPVEQPTEERSVGQEEASSAKIIQFTSPHLSEIYERILNRTMS